MVPDKLKIVEEAYEIIMRKIYDLQQPLLSLSSREVI
jgi:hypothetical protein